MVARRQLVEMIGMECNRQRTARSPEALKGIARTLKAVQAALAAIDREIDDKLSGSPAWRVAKDLCTAPGSLDNGLHYAAALRLSAIQRSLAAVGLTRPFFSTSHSVL
jgi:hypothetical protein